MSRTYTLYEDAGHSWLQVPKTELKELEIDKQISGYSYEDDIFAYLEEDCDLAIFVNAKGRSVLGRSWDLYINQENWFKRNVKTVWDGNNSPIRNLNHYKN